MGILSKLYVDDYEFTVLRYNWNFNQNANAVGRPSGQPTGGLITLHIETQKNDPFTDWAMSNDMQKNIKIVQKATTQSSKSRVLEFYDVFCLEMTDNFNGIDNQPMTTTLVLSAGIMGVNGATMMEKYWKVTDLNSDAAIHGNEAEESTPVIAKIDWIDPETKETIEETTYTNNVTLLIKVNNPSGNAVNVTITKKDGTEFEEGKKELVFSETLNEEDNTVEISTLEIKEQWEAFKEADKDELIAKVTHSNISKESKALPVTPTPKVLDNFRTGNSYKGEYGFDWIRMEDTGKPGDVWYKKIIGKNEYYKDSSGNFILDSDGDKIQNVQNHIQSDAEYIKLGKEFEMLDHPIKGNDKYVVPALPILPNNKATLTLKVEIEVADAKKIEYEYNNEYLKLNKTEVSHKTIGKKELADDLIIECVKEFSTDQFVNVKADGKFAGKLKVLANDKANRRVSKIVFVNVVTDINSNNPSGLDGISAADSTTQENNLSPFLKQALTNPDIENETLNLFDNTKTEVQTLNTDYTLSVGRTKIFHKYSNSGGVSLVNFLNQQFNNQPAFSRYSNYYKVFFLGEQGGRNDSSGGIKYLGGHANNIPSKECVMYANPKPFFVAHELMHCMGLHHSFDNNGKHTFKIGQTENIMDYSHMTTYAQPNGTLKQISTWEWQWKILKNSNENET